VSCDSVEHLHTQTKRVSGPAVELGCTGRPNDSKGVDMVRYYHRLAAPVIALGLALAAAGPASARVNLNPAPVATSGSSQSTNLCSEVCSASGYTAGTRSGATLSHDPRPRSVALAGGSAQPRPATVVRVVTPKDGFDWGDAGIGAGGAVVLMTLAGGSALAVTAARRRVTRSTA
jgi:hypothetical protein